MSTHITIHGRTIGSGRPTYVIAEMSANHGQDFSRAVEIIRAMKESGADAVKIQTYTPDTITIDCDNPFFVDCLKGTIWEGKSLYALYGEAYTPWEWQGKLKEEAELLGMDFFSTPFDITAVDFLETLNVPAYKIASFELVHHPLLARVGKTRKPVILSTGMATKEEIAEAVGVLRAAGTEEISLLKCTSAYPARMEDANLQTIPAMMADFGVPVGLSDHTLGHAVPVTAVSRGACIVEKHFVLDRERDKGPDSAFSMEPQEFKAMVDAVREAEKNPEAAPIEESALGSVTYGPTRADKGSVVFRPSVFVIEDIAAGETFTEKNVRIIRPGYGLPPKELGSILGKTAVVSIRRGTPFSRELAMVG
ncbi:MAG: pseudaminic acid synthase [Candidatus Peribacteraceae bacterium]|nr:pseudaminic acid synthase [Candidatus Peribacteraceae bacterium]